jgi:hypothetical protein
VQVQHELGQGAVQAGDLALHDHETGAGELDAVLEVDALGRLTQIDVIAYREIELARGTPAADLHVVVLVTAHRGGLARQVGDGVGDPLELGQQGLQLDLAGLELVVDLGHLGLERATSSPRRAASPMDLERALRSACSSWVRDCRSCVSLPEH